MRSSVYFYRFSRVYIPWSDIEWIEDRDKQILISPRIGSIKAVSFGATNSWGLKFQRRGQNEDIRYFGSVWLCTRCRLFSCSNWKWVGRDSRWIWSRKTSRVSCIKKITGNENCSYKMDWNKRCHFYRVSPVPKKNRN